LLRQWLASDAPAVISCDGPLLTSRRTWSCQLPQAPATMPCGGTHVRRLGLIAGITVSGVLNETGTALTLSARTSLPQSPLAAHASDNTAALA
jgi:alanyl-tRNA synthetase